VTGDCHARFRESRGVRLPRPLDTFPEVGQRSFQVEHYLSRREREITYTDERMAVKGRKFRDSEGPFGTNFGVDA
jgi:hypothetical protein